MKKEIIKKKFEETFKTELSRDLTTLFDWWWKIIEQREQNKCPFNKRENPPCDVCEKEKLLKEILEKLPKEKLNRHQFDKENWVEGFENRFYEKDAHPSQADVIHRAYGEELKDFIRQLLETQKQEIMEESPKEKEADFRSSDYGKGFVDGHNSTLTEIKKLLTTPPNQIRGTN